MIRETWVVPRVADNNKHIETPACYTAALLICTEWLDRGRPARYLSVALVVLNLNMSPVQTMFA